MVNCEWSMSTTYNSPHSTKRQQIFQNDQMNKQ